jgi:hypothetical protein
MEREGIKPHHHPITEASPEQGPGRAVSSFCAPMIRVPDLVSPPSWSAAAIGYVVALFLMLWAGVLIGEGVWLQSMEVAEARLGAGLSFLFLVAGTIQTFFCRASQSRINPVAVSVLTIGYCAFTVLYDPFVYIGGRGTQRLIIPIAWLFPLFLAAVWFARRRCLLQAIGVALFIFACVILITINLYRSMDGFHVKIRE